MNLEMKQETEAAHKGRSVAEAEGVAVFPVARLPEAVAWVRKTGSKVRVRKSRINIAW